MKGENGCSIPLVSSLTLILYVLYSLPWLNKYLIWYSSINFVRVLREVLLQWQSSELLHLWIIRFFLAMWRKVLIFAFWWRNCFNWIIMSQEGKIWKDPSVTTVPHVQLPFATISNPSPMICQHPSILSLLSTHFFLPLSTNSSPLNVKATRS